MSAAWLQPTTSFGRIVVMAQTDAAAEAMGAFGE
jgi:hypothetical protein